MMKKAVISMLLAVAREALEYDENRGFTSYAPSALFSLLHENISSKLNWWERRERNVISSCGRIAKKDLNSSTRYLSSGLPELLFLSTLFYTCMRGRGPSHSWHPFLRISIKLTEACVVVNMHLSRIRKLCQRHKTGTTFNIALILK